ncbi:MBL fold metallo-hydrolase [Microbacterium sp. NPDC008134]|uniref:MBL fold metallo-hydrolase n=1 Tax=Microbacterium sp. NPDC008134 TaxID=3364183 RepID=UPI0036EB9288
MIFTVVAVGDGACSVVRGWPDSQVMLVDCGTAGNAGVSASGTLAMELRWHTALIDTVVITHFDADHWRGLRDLPQHWVYPPGREVELRYPALLPGDAGLTQRAYVALQASRLSGPIFGALDLVGAWQREGVAVRRRPSIRGDRFWGGGSLWSVHWPPTDDHRFDDRTQRRLRRLGTEIRTLAQQVDEFGVALDAVQAAWFGGDDNSVDVDQLNRVTAAELSDALKGALGDEGFEGFAKRLGAFTNELSLVHSNELVANFGDCEKSGLKALFKMEADDQTLRASYPIILAPHHGTTKVSKAVRDRFPRASHGLVSQNGEKRYLDGQRDNQKAFKDAVTSGGGQELNTYNPSLAPSPHGPHVRFWLPS